MIRKTHGSSWAEYSDDMKYRYILHRSLGRPSLTTPDPTKGEILFLMLNPSTATEKENDPTVERCQRRAIFLGYGRMAVCNIFAWRSTDPRVLVRVADPVGEDNNGAIASMARRADLVVCGWGRKGSIRSRGAAVLAILGAMGVVPHCFRQNSDWSPEHPLYIPYLCQPVPLKDGFRESNR